MNANELALVRGWADTRRTLAAWRGRPAGVLLPWAMLALAVAAALLSAVWAVASLVTPPPPFSDVPVLPWRRSWEGYAFVLYRNGLVLALHAMACVAGFIAGSSLPRVAEGYTGVWRRVHDRAGPLAIGFVVLATLFSLVTQAYTLGLHAADLASFMHVSPFVLLLGLLPHAVPELTALFLPLAAWTLASRRGAWDELLAATLVTVAIAAPVLVATAAVETWVTPQVLAILSEATAARGA